MSPLTCSILPQDGQLNGDAYTATKTNIQTIKPESENGNQIAIPSEQIEPSHTFSRQDFGKTESFFLDYKGPDSKKTTWNGPDLLDPNTRAVDVLQYSYELLGERCGCLVYSFGIISSGVLVFRDGKIAKIADHTAMEPEQVFNDSRQLALEYLERAYKKCYENCIVSFGLIHRCNLRSRDDAVVSVRLAHGPNVCEEISFSLLSLSS